MVGRDAAQRGVEQRPRQRPGLSGLHARHLADDACHADYGSLTLTPDLADILQRLELSGHLESADRYGSGHINDTYLVRIKHESGTKRYVLQRINKNVFADPAAVMENISRITEHIRNNAQESHDGLLARQPQLAPIRARDGRPYCQDSDGDCWRLWPFIYGASTFDTVQSAQQAQEAAAAFGRFQCLIHDLPGPRLHETIVGFHDTPARFAHFHEALEIDAHDRAKSCRREIDFALSHEASAGALCELQARGEFPERIAHNDAKINNVMFDDATGRAACIIDLDTVMPGLALNDFGDLVRTATTPSAEDEVEQDQVRMHMQMFERLVEGYMSSAVEFLTVAEIENLAIAGKIITLETGLRFLTDYVAGDQYFRIHRPDQNLDRCRTQFALAASIDAQLEAMHDVAMATYARLADGRRW